MADKHVIYGLQCCDHWCTQDSLWPQLWIFGDKSFTIYLPSLIWRWTANAIESTNAVAMSSLTSYRHIRDQNYDVWVCSPPMAFHRHRNRWHWMILNSNFALNAVFRVESFSMDALDLRRDCSKIDGDAYTVSSKDVAHGLCFLAI